LGGYNVWVREWLQKVVSGSGFREWLQFGRTLMHQRINWLLEWIPPYIIGLVLGLFSGLFLGLFLGLFCGE